MGRCLFGDNAPFFIRATQIKDWSWDEDGEFLTPGWRLNEDDNEPLDRMKGHEHPGRFVSFRAI